MSWNETFENRREWRELLFIICSKMKDPWIKRRLSQTRAAARSVTRSQLHTGQYPISININGGLNAMAVRGYEGETVDVFQRKKKNKKRKKEKKKMISKKPWEISHRLSADSHALRALLPTRGSQAHKLLESFKVKRLAGPRPSRSNTSEACGSRASLSAPYPWTRHRGGAPPFYFTSATGQASTRPPRYPRTPHQSSFRPTSRRPAVTCRWIN